ncbi:Vitamin K epoxide reductase family protein [Chryseobacterium ureilyticum]|uniref:Vitamin K epoxide reductase family protein n=1 Tax=Chryseobacterium ureilyticum TaxID=373668 RepID=A0A1N7QH61_9FLAO|nr:vitamin K epoxide reductase family protein [Chryseobacterium ureilyticum]SIT22210.1 Vitamin K epoxide reductase family protein [Chryseobacterium ureilyticum]
MAESIDNILKYLKKKDILLERKTFTSQIQSHPAFPSLMSIISALNVNFIYNYAIEIENSEVHELPNDFLTYVELKDNQSELVFVEKANTDYLINGKHTLDENDFLKKWNNIVILIDETHSIPQKTSNNRHIPWVIVGLVLILLIFAAYQINRFSFIYLLLSLCGFFMSVLSLRKIFGIENHIVNRVCSGNYTDCSFSNDTKSKNFVSNFGDFSLVYFFSNIVSLLLLQASHNDGVFLMIQKILLIVIFPVIGYSLFYQIFRIKKICPLCIGIILVLLLQTYILLM